MPTEAGFLAIDAASGDLNWRGDRWAGIPAVEDGTVFVGPLGGEELTPAITALDAGSGERIWRRDDVGVTRGAPTVTEGNVLFPTDRGLLALDPDTGETQWRGRAPVGNGNYVTVAYGVAYAITPGNRSLAARDAASGDLYWSTDLQAGIPQQMAVGRETVVLSHQEGIRAFDATDGSRKWERQLEGIEPSEPSIAGEVVYVADGSETLYGLDLDSGDELFGYDVGEEVRGPIPVVDGRLYLNGFGGLFKILE